MLGRIVIQLHLHVAHRGFYQYFSLFHCFLLLRTARHYSHAARDINPVSYTHLCLAKRGVPARPLVRQRHRLLHPAAAVGGILDSRMVRLHRPLALPLLCVLLHLFLFAVFHHFRSQYPLFRLLLQAHQFLHIQLVRLRGHHGGNGIRRNVLLPSHRLGTGSHRGFCLHHPPAVAHVLPFKPERRAPGKQMEDVYKRQGQK